MSDNFERAATLLDSELTLAIQAIGKSQWSEAREALSRRLGNVDQLGSERLNLFLLAATALLSGHQEVGLQLRAQAEKIPCGMGEPRYLASAASGPVSDILQTIETKWWKFNNWGESEAATISDSQPLEDIDWEHILNAAIEGDHRSLETRWARHLNRSNSDKRFLTNFFALAYLLGSDSSTYEEMREAAVIRSEIQPPPELVEALEARGLTAALDRLLSGHWITSTELENPTVSEPFQEPSAPAEFENFIEEYTKAFTDYRLHQLGAAQQILRRMDPAVTSLSLSQELLASVLQSAIAVKDGDHISLQFHQDRLKDLQSVPNHDQGLLDLGCRLFSENGQVGVEHYLQAISKGAPTAFDPWNAFEIY